MPVFADMFNRTIRQWPVPAIFLVLTMTMMIPAQARAQEDDSSTSRPPSVPYYAEAPVRRHALYAEMLGSGIFYSLNYEYRMQKWWAIRAGGGIITSNAAKTYTNMVLMAMFVSSDDGNALEAGVGGVGIRMGGSSASAHFGVAGAFALGYRYQPAEGGVLLRVTFTPLYYKRFSLDKYEITYWRTMVGLSIGYAF